VTSVFSISHLPSFVSSKTMFCFFQVVGHVPASGTCTPSARQSRCSPTKPHSRDDKGYPKLESFILCSFQHARAVHYTKHIIIENTSESPRNLRPVRHSPLFANVVSNRPQEARLLPHRFNYTPAQRSLRIQLLTQQLLCPKCTATHHLTTTNSVDLGTT
jgi:hypothetical protein